MAKKKEEVVEATSDKTSLESSLDIFDTFDKDFAGFKIKQAAINTIDTGSPMLNFTIGIPGFPRGRITHLYGPNGAGKSFMAMLAIKNALNADPTAVAVWFDAENSFSCDWGQKMGIWNSDPKLCRTKVIKGNKGKDIFERIVGRFSKDAMGNIKKVKEGLIDYIQSKKLNCPIMVIDSLADIVSPREQNAPVGGLTVAALPGFLTAELKRVAYLIEETDTAFVCINQVRQNIDEMSQRREGKYHFPGGENLAHKMSLNILCDKIWTKDATIYADESDTNSIIGRRTKLTIKKNRFGPAPRTCETTFIFTEGGKYNQIGIGDYEHEIIDIAVKLDLIKQGGAWYNLNYNGKTGSFQGTAKLYDYYKANKKELDELYELVKITKPTLAITTDDNKEEEELNELLESNPEE